MRREGRINSTLRKGGRGKPDGDARAASNAALHLDPSFMAIDDPFHQAQAKPRALDRRRPRGIPAVEALEDVWDHAGCHADAGVANIDPGAAAVARHAHADTAAMGRVLDGVVE